MAVQTVITAFKEKLLLSYLEVTAPELLGCTVRHAQKLVAKGLMPRPIKIGNSVRFRRQEIIDWIDAGCPAVSESAGSVASK